MNAPEKVKRVYQWGSSYQRRERRAKVWARDAIEGVARCHFCVAPVRSAADANLIRWPITAAKGGRFTVANLVIVCATCARSPARRS